jgi:PAS domain S-box-containing protein
VTGVGVRSEPDRDVDVRQSVAAWRQEIATQLLWLLTATGILTVLAYLPLLLAAGGWPLIALSVLQNGFSATLAWRKDWPVVLRGSWATMNLASSGIAALVVGGDRGVGLAFLLGAVFFSSLLVGWRQAAGVTVMLVVSLIGFGVAQEPLGLPLSPEIAARIGTVRGWAGLAVVGGLVATLALVATEQTFRKLRSLLQSQRDTLRERETALQALLDEKNARRSASDALADALDALRAGYWELDMRTGATRWSDGTYALFGYEPGSVTPSSELWRARTHPDDYARLAATPLQERSTTEYRVLLPDGGTRWLRAVSQTVFDPDGAPVRRRGIVTDVTDERSTSRQLTRLAEVAARTANAVVVADLDGRIEWVNDAFTRLTGWPLADVLGRRPGSFLQGPHTDPAARARMAAAIAAREPFDCEVLNYTRDGRQYWVHIETRVSRDDNGQPTGFVAVETDVTERRLVAQRDQLGQRIAALLLESETIDEAAPRIAAELVRELDIRTAQMWRVEPGRTELVYLAGAAAPATGEAGLGFLERSRGTPFREGTGIEIGVGVPGTAWGTKRAVTVNRLADVRSRRLAAADAAGVVTFCAAPILGVDGVLGVLEIGGSAFYPGHDLFPQTLERIAEQLASFLRHDMSRRAFQAIFEHSPDALLLVDDGGRVHGANPRATRVFGAPVGADVDALLKGGRALIAATPTPDDADGTPASSSGNGVQREVRLLHADAHGAHGPFSAELTVGTAPPSTRLGAIVAVRDLTERHAMEAALTHSLREKDTLLREVHHRVKNNLQIVSSLLTLQADGLEPGDARTALSDTVFRVRSMAYVHQQLYGTEDVDSVDLGDYARTLCTALQGSLDPRARLRFALQKVDVAIDDAVPCALILNELVTNALKHGRGADGTCDLAVEVHRDGGDIVLVVADRGPGLPATPTTSVSLGMQLVRSLTRQLRGRLEFVHDHGTRAVLRLPGKS